MPINLSILDFKAVKISYVIPLSATINLSILDFKVV